MCPPFGYLYFLIFYNEPELGVGIDPSMALTPLPSSIGRGSNPRPSDHEPSALPLDHSFCLPYKTCGRLFLAYLGAHISGKFESEITPIVTAHKQTAQKYFPVY